MRINAITNTNFNGLINIDNEKYVNTDFITQINSRKDFPVNNKYVEIHTVKNNDEYGEVIKIYDTPIEEVIEAYKRACESPRTISNLYTKEKNF